MSIREQTQILFANWMQSVDGQNEEVLVIDTRFGNFMNRMHESITEYSRLLAETREIITFQLINTVFKIGTVGHILTMLQHIDR